MKFLYTENVNDEEVFVKNIKCIQQNYNELYLAVIGIGYHITIKDYNICALARDKIDVNYNNDLAYQTNQCFVTREFLMYLMLGDTMERSLQRSVDKIIIKSSIQKEIKDTISKIFRREHDKNVYIYQIDIGGKIQDEFSYSKFPDHTLILIKYKGKFYIIQSFYNAYSFDSLYGFIELERNDVNEFSEIIQDYARIIKNPNVDFQGLFDTNQRFSYFTGINLYKHFLFMQPMDKLIPNPPHIKIKSLKTTSKSFFKNIKNNINNIYRSIDSWISNNIKNNELIEHKMEVEYTRYTASIIRNTKNKNKKKQNMNERIALYEEHENIINELKMSLYKPPNVSQFYLKYYLYDCFTSNAIQKGIENIIITSSIPTICDFIEIEKNPTSSSIEKKSALEIIKKLTGYRVRDSPKFGLSDPYCFIDSDPDYTFIMFEKMYNIKMDKLKNKIELCMG